MPLHPQAQEVIDATRALGLPPNHTVSPAEARANVAEVGGVPGGGSGAGSQAAAQIRRLKSIAPGWHHEAPSVAPDPEGLEWLAARFERDYPAAAPSPYIFPDPEGAVTALWKISDQVQVEAEINLSRRTAALWIHCLSTLTAQYDVVDLKETNALRDIGDRNAALAQAAR